MKEQLEKSMTAFGFSIIQTLVSCQEWLKFIDSLFAMTFKHHLQFVTCIMFDCLSCWLTGH